MAPELPALSLLCAILLACLLPAYWSSRNVAMLALIWWLIISNIIQGVNAIAWAGNVEVKIAAWCDIGSKLLLGARVALPAACICLANRVRHLLVTGDAKGGIGVLSFDLISCIIVPIVYMILHIIVQDHRFDLTENFGCSASVYDSVPALFLVWLPPLILCIAAFVLTCITTYSGYRRGFTLMSTTRRLRSGQHHTFDFLRPLLRSSLISSLLLASSAFSLHAALASSPRLLPWTSWHVVHAHLSRVHVIPGTSRLQIVNVQIVWWTIPACSLVLIAIFFLNLACGSCEDSLQGYLTVVQRIRGRLSGQRELRLSASSSVMDLQPQMHMSSKRSVETFASIHPIDPERKGSMRSMTRSRVKLAPLSIPVDRDIAASPPTSTLSDDTDITFAQSAMSYLDSPIGRAAVASMPRPPSIFRPSNVPGHLPDMPPPTFAVGTTEVVPTSDSEQPVARRRPASIIAGPWPRPPSSIPPSPVKSVRLSPTSPVQFSATLAAPSPAFHRPRPPSDASLDTSLVSSTVSAAAYAVEPAHALHDSPTLPYFPPFADASVPANQMHAQGLSMAIPKQMRRTRSKDGLPTLTRNLSLSALRARERKAEGRLGDEGAIYMTVVQETV